MHESDDEQSKRMFYYYESNDNKNNNIENNDSLSRYIYVCKVCCLKKPYNLVITWKYQTLVLCTDLGLIFSRHDRTLG